MENETIDHRWLTMTGDEYAAARLLDSLGVADDQGSLTFEENEAARDRYREQITTEYCKYIESVLSKQEQKKESN